jgi:hypothetical protein
MALAASTRVNLRLDHPEAAADLLRRLLGVGRRKDRHAARHRRAELAKDCLCLVLVDVHGCSP